MKPKATLLFTVVAVILASLSAPRCAKADDIGKINALEQDLAKAFRAKDVTAAMKCYVPGSELFVFDLVPPRQYVGFDAYKKDWEDTFAMFDGPVAFDISDLQVLTDHALGFSHSIQHVSGKLKDGSPLDLTVRVTDVYRRIGRKWYIVHEHVSVPVDLTTGKPDLQSKP